MRTDGSATRKRILRVAEKLFSTRGFDATSVDQIARIAKVNKALIYYHFENKAELVLKLFESILEEVSTHAKEASATTPPTNGRLLGVEIQKEVEYLAGRKQILSLMLAEALRSNRHETFLFRCAELVIQNEHPEELLPKESGTGSSLPRSRMVHEFFTGFIPLVAFVALRDKWCSYFGYDPDQITAEFVEAFVNSHLKSQAPVQPQKHRR